MDALTVIAEKTGGSVDIVDATSLQEKLASLSSPTLATDVTVVLRASSGIKITDAASGNSGCCVSVVFPTVREASDALFNLEIDFAAQTSSLVMQSEIRWTTPCGQEHVRVMTERLAASSDRATVEKESNLNYSAVCSLRESARLSQEDQVDEARVVLISTLRLLQRGMRSVESQATMLRFVRHAEQLDGWLREVQQRKEVEKLFQIADETNRDDYAARNIIQAKSLSLVDFTTK